jgi:hypothetical protein
VLVSNDNGLAAFRYADGSLEPGPRSAGGRGAQILAAGPFGPNGAAAVAYGSRDAARVAIAPVDARGAVGVPELIDLPALPRVAHVAALGSAAPAGLFVAHDSGMSVIVRGGDGWHRHDAAVSPYTRDFAVADLDGDGRADLVVADQGANQLLVLHGNGDGGFAPGEHLATVRAPRRLVIADVNGDRQPDVLVIGDDGLAVHLGEGSGRFAALQRLQKVVLYMRWRDQHSG